MNNQTDVLNNIYSLKFNFLLSINLWVNFGASNDAPCYFGEILQKQIYEKDLSPYSLIALSHKYTLDKMQKIVNNVNIGKSPKGG
jgi:hypothetical protein